ncbi:MAG: TrmH family RNA methyltransferase, partial [Bacteroidetes bacterium]|nr:TrmH family RNA methyltransferase [Bacteroidota bacterium]
LHNVGAAFRNADAFGIHELWISGFTPTPPRPEITKTAIGAEEHVSWKKIENEIQQIHQIKNEGYRVLALEQTNESIPIHQYQLSGRPVCLILGNEVTGVEEEILQETDASIEIPQFGMKHSLNVSVASGVALYAFYEKFSRTAH